MGGGRIREACPDGVDVFFDNVGGEIRDAALDHLAFGGRIVLCGAISGYSDFEHRPGIRNHYRLIVQRATMRGFLIFDHMDRDPPGPLESLLPSTTGSRVRFRTKSGSKPMPDPAPQP